jgi:hypothetical protein
VAIQEIFDIVFVYQRPAQLSTESMSQRAFPTARKAFHHDQPHGHEPASLRAQTLDEPHYRYIILALSYVIFFIQARFFANDAASRAVA